MSCGLAHVGLLDQPIDTGHLDQPPRANGNGFKLAVRYQFVSFRFANAQASRSVCDTAQDGSYRRFHFFWFPVFGSVPHHAVTLEHRQNDNCGTTRSEGSMKSFRGKLPEVSARRWQGAVCRTHIFDV